MENEDKEIEFAKIKVDYKKALDNTTEKVQVAEECYGLVDRDLRKISKNNISKLGFLLAIKPNKHELDDF